MRIFAHRFLGLQAQAAQTPAPTSWNGHNSAVNTKAAIPADPIRRM
jgi:hypothetical protein